ncbi:YedE family putative selenium transporter [Bengtsoniella intestinalis]|uniref:YedE family putative selenium transporter n=1 Tax=Bengtsoniella intestinalis TaxID=3073143 RepID=UPI00391F5AAF
MKETKRWIIVAGGVTGLAVLLLTWLGNPVNMGFCIACFERDIAGALGLHSATVVQYLRPEILGLILGAFVLAVVRGEFRPKAGSSLATRFVLGMIVMQGALVFLGCPLRMLLRLGGGDLNALTALAGFVAGIAVGLFVLKHGFTLKRAYPVSKGEGAVLPAIAAVLLVLGFAMPTIFKVSESGLGAMQAPAVAAFAIALVVGALAQRARLCTLGGIRDFMLFRSTDLLYGMIGILAITVVGNLALGSFKLGFELQTVAHSSHLWNFLGMALVGWASVLLGGCPLRQLVLAGEGNGDSAVTVFGMVMGAAFVHNFGLAGSADSLSDAGEVVVGGISSGSQMMVIGSFVVLGLISWYHAKQPKQVKVEGKK